MTPLSFQRNRWQVSFSFEQSLQATSDPSALGHLFTELPRVLPEPTASWDFPALTQDRILVQLGGAGEVQTPIAVGATISGWHLELTSKQLVVRHQVEVSGISVPTTTTGLHGTRAPGGMPSRHDFLTIAQKALEALPRAQRDTISRMGTLVEYAATSPGHPGAWISTTFGGHHADSDLPDRVRAVRHHHSYEFEHIWGQRQVWNDVIRMGNWFGPDGMLRRDEGVVILTEVRTAVTEIKGVPGGASAEAPPPIDTVTLHRSLNSGPEGALAIAVERVRARIAQRGAIDD